METTFFAQISRAANLCILLQHPQAQRSIPEVIDAYNAFIQEDRHGTQIDDDLRLLKDYFGARDGARESKSAQQRTPRSKTGSLTREAYQSLILLLNREQGSDLYADRYCLAKRPEQLYLRQDIQELPLLSRNDVTYKSLGNDGNVVLSGERGQPSLYAARITGIFEHTQNQVHEQATTQIFLAIQHLQPLSANDIPSDHYCKFEHYVGGFLCYDNYSTSLDLVRPMSLVCHYAHTSLIIEPIAPPCAHVLPLDQVCTYKRIAYPQQSFLTSSTATATAQYCRSYELARQR